MLKKDFPKIVTEQTDAPLSDDIPHGFSKFTQFKPLKDGGIASIMTCVDTVLNRTVAYKSLLPGLQDVETEKKRFIREARVTAYLQHPNIPAVYDLGKNKMGALFFTMKYIEGETLQFVISCLARNDKRFEKNFTLNNLLNVVIHAGQGISYAHQRGVIHRDLKPGNILIGTFGEVMLIDWGIAKVWNAPENDGVVSSIDRYNDGLDITQMGARPGTPLYMSPEQIRGDKIDERADIYSLGAILYEMLTMETVFKANNINDLLIKVKSEDAVLPSRKVTDRYIPKRVEEICMKAISKDREDRYETMDDFVNDLRDFVFQASVAVI